MIKNIGPKDLIFLDEFVKKPVDKIGESINNTATNKVILSGTRGSGKTTVLYNYGYDSILTLNPSIYTRFDSVLLFGDNRAGWKAYFDESFITHVYEVEMARKVISYIKLYYGSLFEQYFKDDEARIIFLENEINNYIRNCAYQDININKRMSMGELTTDLIDRFKNDAHIDRLNLIVDRFDWTDGNSEIAQNTLSKYFDLFDKSIVTTDDDSLLNDQNSRVPLIENGFSFVDVNYGKDIDVIKELIALRVKRYNSNRPESDYEFPIDLITDDIYKRLIEKTKGNISVILSTINEFNNNWQWNYHYRFGRGFDFMEQMERCSNEKLAMARDLKCRAKTIKLHFNK